MPRWVYAPEYDDLYVVDDYATKEHEALARDLYAAHNDTPEDDSGWNKWWGGMIHGGPYSGEATGWVVDYVPLDIANKSDYEGYDSGYTVAKQYAPESLKAKMEQEVQKYKASFKTTASEKPLLFLDVDGVLISYHPYEGVEYDTITYNGYDMDMYRGVGQVLAALAPYYEMVWATTWAGQANLLREHFGLLQDLPVVEIHGHPKVDDIKAYANGRRFAWVDDGAWDEKTSQHLFVHVSPLRGLTEEYIPELIDFAQGAKTSATLQQGDRVGAKPLYAEPDTYAPNPKYLSPSPQTFGYVNGNIIFANTHHQGIMAMLLDKGWTWEQLFEVPQLWGWIHIYPSMHDGQYSASVRFTSDSGIQHKDIIPDFLKAAADALGMSVWESDQESYGVRKDDLYGGGLSQDRTKAEDAADKYRRRVYDDPPDPPNTWKGDRRKFLWPFSGSTEYLLDSKVGSVSVHFMDGPDSEPTDIYRWILVKNDLYFGDAHSWSHWEMLTEVSENPEDYEWLQNDYAEGFYYVKPGRTKIEDRSSDIPLSSGELTEIVADAFDNYRRSGSLIGEQ